MAIVSIDKTAEGVAIKLGENARVSPERLMEFLADNPTASFSPSGILRIAVETGDPLASAISCLDQIKL